MEQKSRAGCQSMYPNLDDVVGCRAGGVPAGVDDAETRAGGDGLDWGALLKIRQDTPKRSEVCSIASVMV